MREKTKGNNKESQRKHQEKPSRDPSCQSEPPWLGASDLRPLQQAQAPHVLPVPLPEEWLRHDISAHICCRNIIERDQVACYSLSNEMVPYIYVFRSIVELGVGGKLDRSLVIGENSLRPAPGGVDTRRGFGAVCVKQRLPLLRGAALVVRAEVRQRLPNLAGFQLPEQAAEPYNLLHSVRQRYILRLGGR